MEIERKFLIKSLNLDHLPDDHREVDISSYYLMGFDKVEEARIAAHEDEYGVKFWLVKKKKREGISRREIVDELTFREIVDELTFREFLSLYDTKIDDESHPIHKTRFMFWEDDVLFELDVFEDTYLTLLEVELQSEDQEVVIPEWLDVIREVTDEEAFYSRNIARKLFSG